MRVEALKTENGFFIPIKGELRNIRQERIILEIEIVNENESCVLSESDGFYGIFKTNERGQIKKITEDKGIYYDIRFERPLRQNCFCGCKCDNLSSSGNE